MRTGIQRMMSPRSQRALFIGLVWLGPIMTATAVAPPSQPYESFFGEVSGGNRYERELKSGLVFRLEPGRDGGYIIWLGDRSAPKEDYCAVLTPPFHGPNDLNIWADEVTSDDFSRINNRPGKHRSFRCVLNRNDYKNALAALQNARQPNEAASRPGPDFSPPINGRLTITDATAIRRDAKHVSIDFMRFHVELLPADQPSSHGLRLPTQEEIEAPIAPAEAGAEEFRLVDSSPIPREDPDAWLRVTLHRSSGSPQGYRPPQDVVRFWRKEGPGGFVLIKELRSGDVGEHFDAVQTFKALGRTFAFSPCELDGTGHIRCDSIYVLNDSESLEDVEFEHAPEAYKARLRPGEGVWKGENNTVDPACIRFQFFIWRKSDPNCCPTAGKVSGKYSVIRQGSGFKIKPEDFDRTSVK